MNYFTVVHHCHKLVVITIIQKLVRLVPAVTPPAPASFQIRVGTVPCNGGICGAYTGTGSPGPFITVYVLAGQTPATAPVIYTNSLLTVILTPPFFEYGGKLYSNIGGSGTLECILGSGC
jgi:hypothetical protein